MPKFVTNGYPVQGVNTKGWAVSAEPPLHPQVVTVPKKLCEVLLPMATPDGHLQLQVRAFRIKPLLIASSPTAWKAWGTSNKASGWFGAAARNLETGSARFHIKVPFLKVSHKGAGLEPQGSTLKSSGSQGSRFHS